MQMYDGGDYDWDAIYSSIEASPRASYVEIYLSSFSTDRSATLNTNIRDFDTRFCR